MDANVVQTQDYTALIQQTKEILAQPINWNNLPEALGQIFYKIMSMFSLGLPVVVLFFIECLIVEKLLERYFSLGGIIGWSISIIAVLIIVMPLTVGIFLPIICDLLASIGVS
ncbi:MAG: hypothetical protein ACTSV7_14860 [Candidatus Baldrarchaeia archaeon]